MRIVKLEELDFGTIIRPGNTVAWNMGCGEPLSLSRRLIEQRHAVGGIFNLVLGTIYSDTVRPEHCDVIRVTSVAGSGPSRKLAEAGKLDILPVAVSEFAGLIRSRRLPVDVALVQLAEDPATGELSYGAVNAYGPDLLHSARIVIAEINSQTPFTGSCVPVDRDRITLAVRTDVPMVELKERAGDARDAQIASHVASLVPDGGVLQIGMGSLPRAVLRALRGHRDLGVLSGGMGDDCVDLIEAGVITNARKKADPGVSVTGLLLGSRKVYDFAHRNPAVRVDPVSYTHDFNVLSACDRLIAINSAIEVDLTGQANGEVAGGKYLGAVGGQAEFIRGAKAADGGLAILALASTTSRGQSRIVPRIPSGIVSTSRADIDCVVTEYGVAHLRGCALSERARRLIAIAHPDHRDALERAARCEPGSRTFYPTHQEEINP
ncbi:MAG TPA: acetyl-CoA hydrolase/transferase C-terminal domain-containing protein [Ramlibacter sp.]|nr:acetyl-CoA hydrolase/transferase C-terminal domain-containing protein [Ramlibacter sp.]